MKDFLAKLIVSCLPKRVIYYAGMRIWLFSTVGKYDTIVPEITVGEALKRWATDYNI